VNLLLYLKRAGVITGPLAKATSHSAMEVTKKHLLCLPQFKGGEDYLVFGSAAHETYYKGDFDNAFKRLDDEQRERIKAMLKSLDKHPVAKSLRQGAVCEQRTEVELNGVKVTVILDAEQKKLSRVSDLKTTKCKTLQQVEAKAGEYSYPRQLTTYKLGRRHRNAYNVFVCVEPPHEVFIYDLSRYPDEISYAERELEFLLYFTKHYGKITIEDTMTGKEALASIKDATKLLIDQRKAYDAAIKNVNSAFRAFPKKEVELYADEISKAQQRVEKILK